MKAMTVALFITTLAIALTLGTGNAIAQEIVVAYDFDDVAGNMVKDVSGNGNDGELIGDPQQTQGEIGQALVLDGLDDNVNLGDDKFLFDEMTVMFWVNNIGAMEQSWATFFTIREVDGSGLGIYYDKESTEIRIFALKPGVIGEENLRDNDSQKIVDVDWHQIAGVFSANSGRKIYIDGKLAASDEFFIGSGADLKSTNTYIGLGRTECPCERTNVTIDEFVIAQGELSEAAIQGHADSGIAGAGTSVELSGKLATTWATIKDRR